MNAEELKKRTKKFALDVINLVEILPRTKTMDIVGRQLLKSATSIGANYRSVCRAKSKADFMSKIAIVEEEADETIYWLELLIENELIKKHSSEILSKIMKEASELTAIFSASRKSAKINKLSNY